jgi:hypothetical protein
MITSSDARNTTAANFDRMMDCLGIDLGCRVAPRFGLLISCMQRNCVSCSARKTCTEWLANDPDASFGPPKFCPGFDLLCELFYDSAAGRHTHSVA